MHRGHVTERQVGDGEAKPLGEHWQIQPRTLDELDARGRYFGQRTETLETYA